MINFPKLTFSLDVDYVLKRLNIYKNNPQEFLEDCKFHRINGDPNQKILEYPETIHAIQDILRGTKMIYDMYCTNITPGAFGDPYFAYKAKLDVYIEKYNKVKEDQIRQQKDYEERLRRDLIEEWRQQGCLCPKCQKGKMEYYDTGLLKIYYNHSEGGSIGGGVHMDVDCADEYHFHYNKCEQCGHWQMVEWRKMPTWWDDLVGSNQSFTKGDIITEFRYGKFREEGYTGHEIIHF